MSPNPLGTYSEKYVGKHVCIEIWDSGETHQHYIGEVQRIEFYPSRYYYPIDYSHTKTVDKWGWGIKMTRGRIIEPFKSRSQLLRLLPFLDDEYVLKIRLATDNPTEKNTMKISNVSFPRGALPMPKNQPVFLTVDWVARGTREGLEAVELKEYPGT